MKLKETHSKIVNLESKAKIDGIKKVLSGTSQAGKSTQAAEEKVSKPEASEVKKPKPSGFELS
jgi:hypothetical protein